ncbi:MAG: NAD(P)H-dependent oxidoreductase subunit E [Bacteroidales bacterium]|nr:NAD(P)H-dependent oxidoreductase subunit E [Bacteroidales bacterium]MBS3773616.1 NAD(P)H-dependent oxidoreductase subunit E [Bacteroidales bacterium]
MDIKDTLQKYPPTRDNLLLILHEIQRENPGNNITHSDIRQVAKYLNTTTASVYGVVRYYSIFSMNPRGKYIIRFCKSPVCMMVGAFNLLNVLEKELTIRVGETTSDMLFTLEPSECLGHCDKAPVMMLNDTVYYNLDEARLKNIINYLREKEHKKQTKS